MSFYKNPKDVAGFPTEQGTPLPPTILKVQERRGVINASSGREPLSSSSVQNRSSSSQSNPSARDSGLKRRSVLEKPSESSAKPHVPDMLGSVLLGVVEPPVQSAPSSSSPQLDTMRSSDSSSSKPFSSNKEYPGLASGGVSRLSFRRKGASDLHADDQARASARLSWIVISLCILWLFAYIALTFTFVFEYYLVYVSQERDEVGSSVAVSAAALAGTYFTPLYQAVNAFNSSMNSGLLVGPNSFPGVSSIAYPIMNTVPYIVEISVYFNSLSPTTSMRIRPSVANMRIDACNNAYPPSVLGYQLTNTLADAPVILVPQTTSACNDTTNYCRFNLMCEPDEGAESTAISAWTSQLGSTTTGSIIFSGPELYISPDMATNVDDELTPVVSLIANAMYPTRVVGNLYSLGELIKTSFNSSSAIVCITDITGSVLAVSRDSIITLFSMQTNDPGAQARDVDSTAAESGEEFSQTYIMTNSSIFSIDPVENPWVTLLPTTLIDVPKSSFYTSAGWRVDVVRVDGVAGENAFAIVATNRENFTSDFMYGLYISILVVGGIPIVILFIYAVYYLVRKLLKVQSNIRETSTNI